MPAYPMRNVERLVVKMLRSRVQTDESKDTTGKWSAQIDATDMGNTLRLFHYGKCVMITNADEDFKWTCEYAEVISPSDRDGINTAFDVLGVSERVTFEARTNNVR